MEASQIIKYEIRSKEVAVMISTILVGGGFAAVLILKWKFYSDYYNNKTRHQHTF